MIYESIILITEWLAYGIVCLTNSLPNRVVMSDNTNIFKNRLDSFCEGQDIIDFRAQLYGTGSRSEIRIEECY